MIDLVYVLAGLGAIVLIVGAIAGDAIALARQRRSGWRDAPPAPMWEGWYTVGLVALVALWLAAALLR